jgi:hypothetical protein
MGFPLGIGVLEMERSLALVVQECYSRLSEKASEVRRYVAAVNHTQRKDVIRRRLSVRWRFSASSPARSMRYLKG